MRCMFIIELIDLKYRSTETHFKQCVELLQLIDAEGRLCHYGPHLEKEQ